jgi:hypothetical protein
MPQFRPYRTESEIEEVVQRFETCTYSPEEFFHVRHLTVTAWYFLRLDARTAEERMRAGLLNFIRHHRKNGYHETITTFWLGLVRHYRDAPSAARDLVSRINEIVELLSDKNLIYEHYSRELLGSPDAKLRWVAPDLAPLTPEREGLQKKD